MRRYLSAISAFLVAYLVFLAPAMAIRLVGKDGGAKRTAVSSFGENETSYLRPMIFISGIYNIIEPDLVETFVGASGTTTAANSEFVATSGTSVGGYGVIRSRKAIVYHPGRGMTGRWSARFTTPVANSLQFGGLFTSTDGYYIGYNGTDFGCIREYGGVHEIRRLTLSAGASGAESLTIVVNNLSHTFNVAAGTTAQNAVTITNELNANITGWRFFQNTNTITGYQVNVGAASGTYSFTNNTGGGTAAGSWAQITGGATTTRETVTQANWNGQPLDFTLDPTKGNLYQIQAQWMGYGVVRYSIMSPNSGEYINVHTIKYPNNYATPSVYNPSMKLGWSAASLGSTTNLTVYGASAAGFVDGRDISVHPTRAVTNTRSIDTTETPILTVRNQRLFGDKINQSAIISRFMAFSNNSTKTAIFNVYLNATLGTDRNYTYSDQSYSTVEYDTSATTFSGGTLILSFTVASNDSELVYENEGLELTPEDAFTITGYVTSGAASDLSASFTWKEEH